MAKKGAKVEVEVGGVQEAAEELGKMFDAPSEAAQKFFGNLGSLGSFATRAISLGVDSAVAAFDKLYSVDIGKVTAQFVDMGRESARAAAYFNRNSETVRGEAMALARALGIPDDQAAKLVSTFAKMTNTTGDNTKVLGDLHGEALLTGYSIEELATKGADLHNKLGVPLEQLPALFTDVRSAAEAMGTVGGARALHDDLASITGVVTNLADGIRGVTPLVAALGKNLNPEQQKAVSSRFMGYLTTNVEPLRRQLGMKQSDFYDEQGRIKADPLELALKLQKDAIKRYGGRDAARRVMMQESNLGALAGAALFNIAESDVLATKQWQERRRGDAARRAEEARQRVAEDPTERQARYKMKRESLQREIAGRIGLTMEEGSPEYEKFVKNHPLGEMIGRFAAEGAKTFTDKTVGMNRLTGWLADPQVRAAMDPGGDAARAAGASAFTGTADRAARRSAGRAVISALTGVLPDGVQAPAAAALERVRNAPTDSAAIVAAIKDLKAAIEGRPVQVDVVNNTGAPEGTISAYAAGQTRQ